MQELQMDLWIREVKYPEQVEIGEYISTSQFSFYVGKITKTMDENYNVYFLFENRKGFRVKCYEWQTIDVLRGRGDDSRDYGLSLKSGS